MKKDYEMITLCFKEKLTDEEYRKMLDRMTKKGFHLEAVRVSDNIYTFLKCFK